MPSINNTFKLNKAYITEYDYNYNKQLHIDSFGFARGIDLREEQNYLSEYIAKIANNYFFTENQLSPAPLLSI